MKILFASVLFLLVINLLHAQQTPGLQFSQGQVFDISLNIKTNIAQQAMGQAIDFNIEAWGDHRYAVTNATDENTTLHHDVNRLRFQFEGMGQKRSFDSNEEKDMNGPFGKYAKEILEKNYDMIIGKQGQTLVVMPETVSLTVDDPRLTLINTMLKDVVSIVYPPKKNEPGFFQVFPDDTLKTGLAWTRSSSDSAGRIHEIYKIIEMNDSTIVLDYSAESVTITKTQMMGAETVTTLNNKSTGRIVVDGLTHLPLEKKITTESNGSSDGAFGSIPVTSKSEMLMRVTSSGK